MNCLPTSSFQFTFHLVFWWAQQENGYVNRLWRERQLLQSCCKIVTWEKINLLRSRDLFDQSAAGPIGQHTLLWVCLPPSLPFLCALQLHRTCVIYLATIEEQRQTSSYLCAEKLPPFSAHPYTSNQKHSDHSGNVNTEPFLS